MREQLIWWVLGCVAGGVLWAQTVSATFEGLVRDLQGGAVPDAKVIVSNMRTGGNQDVPPDVQGDFVVSHLPPGDYTVTVKESGFREFRQSDIQLDVQQVLSLNIKLLVGDVAATVQVERTPPPLANTRKRTPSNNDTENLIGQPLV